MVRKGWSVVATSSGRYEVVRRSQATVSAVDCQTSAKTRQSQFPATRGGKKKVGENVDIFKGKGGKQRDLIPMLFSLGNIES